MTKQELFQEADRNKGKFLYNGSMESLKQVKCRNELEQHMAVYEYMLTQATKDDLILSEDIIKQMHYLYYQKDVPNKAGQYRTETSTPLKHGHIPPDPEELSHLMEHFISQMENSKRFMHPIEFAAMCLKRLVDIQPFDDGNDFVARLFMNLILVREGYAITLIPQAREEDYRNAIAVSQTKMYPDIDPLIKLIAECVVESQN